MKPHPLRSHNGRRYPGGKNLEGTWQWLVALMPAHSYYAEPFVGSGALLRRKPPALYTEIVDSDPQVVLWWRELRWPGTKLIHGCGIEWLAEAGRAFSEIGGDALVYLDPPYLPETRVKKSIYRQELTPSDHELLLERAKRLDCHVMISGYPAPLYSMALAGWHCESREVITRGATLRTECIWCNFKPHLVAPAQLTMAAAITAAGDGFRARERIKRKCRRWRDNFQRLDARERRAILAGLLEAEWQQRSDA